MHKFVVPTAALAFALATGGAIAQQAQATFSEIDTNGDGALTYEEVEAVFGSRGADGVFRNDTNGDGVLTLDEVVDDPTTTTNPDGTTTTDGGVDYEDLDRGHGNDPDGFDEDNPGRGHGDDGRPGGGNRGGNGNGNGRGNSD